MLKLVLTWDVLGIIGKSRILSLTMLVPFIGYLILFNNELVLHLKLATEIFGDVGNDETVSRETLSRLYFLYYGLTLLGISSIAFFGLCPPIVKDHKSERSYLDSELKLMTHSRYASLVNTYEEILDKESAEYKNLAEYSRKFQSAFDQAEKESRGDKRLVNQREAELKSEAYIDSLGFDWRFKIQSLLIARASIELTYAMGFILVIWPSLQVLFQVTWLIFCSQN